ncbi:uncharacterized protein LODBEIA_P58610 [Lodderomyces beijingensis]|uniref:NAD-dependent epimerase/dehydratase domain-containing protein n=1 Tax=Lodderomyces beijingensis TaxID=1775926 RepID=A0ABP0ZU34_9ASCO
MSKSIAVFGGNGFLGRKICETGINKGYKVTSFSRSGQPPPAVLHQPWVKHVSWSKIDIFQPQEIASQLSEFDAVVHSIGMLFEDQSYKKSADSGIANIANDLRKMANSVMGSNPMQKDKSWMTYEAIQRDSAVNLADEYVKAREASLSSETASSTEKVGTYIYISADQNPPIVPQRYISTKREAELAISSMPHLRTIIMRPGVMYDESHDLGATKRDIIMKGLRFAVGAKNATLGKSFLSGLVRPVVSTTQVAEALFDKLETPEFKGVVSVDSIEQEPNPRP